MKHAGKALCAAIKLIFLALMAACVIGAAGWLFKAGVTLAAIAGGIWLLFALFTLYFFRDPTANTPQERGIVVAPGHGKVDVIEQLTQSGASGAPCHRMSIFLSVIDIHVQNAPVSGKITGITRTAGKFVSALKSDCAAFNENVLIVIDSAETAGEKIGLRLIAGVLARRIVPFVQPGEELRRGDRISLIQFGSRCDLYLPLTYRIKVQLGQKVVGGETVVAAKS
jgi:phosphatidylserine decarboxylase